MKIFLQLLKWYTCGWSPVAEVDCEVTADMAYWRFGIHCSRKTQDGTKRMSICPRCHTTWDKKLKRKSKLWINFSTYLFFPVTESLIQSVSLAWAGQAESNFHVSFRTIYEQPSFPNEPSQIRTWTITISLSHLMRNINKFTAWLRIKRCPCHFHSLNSIMQLIQYYMPTCLCLCRTISTKKRRLTFEALPTWETQMKDSKYKQRKGC